MVRVGYCTQALFLLLHSGCVGNVPVEKVLFLRFTHAHSSPISPLALLYQPLVGCGSVSVSACSWPSTIETPSSVPGLLTEPSPQFPPASGMYGKFVYAITLPFAFSELW